MNTDFIVRPLSFPLQAFMRMIPYLVRLGSPELLGALSAYAPHANIRKLRKIAYFLYDTNAELYWGRRRAILAGDEMAMRRDDALSSLSASIHLVSWTRLRTD